MPEYGDSNNIKLLTSNNYFPRPLFDFEVFGDTIVKIIKGSEPKFSIGIYGEWGTGKTTLMRLIYEKLQRDNHYDILNVWFNAWRYERQEQLAVTALIKTITNAAEKHVIFHDISSLLKKSTSLSKSREEERDSIYHEGLVKLELMMDSLTKGNSAIRLIVFIDDLDRCSPGKVLEILEGIKLFLGIQGFIYIIGIDYETVSQVISVTYKDSGTKGDEYLTDLIHIPIILPKHNFSDMEGLMEILGRNLDKKYSDFIRQNKDLLVMILKPNPVEANRVINNFIVVNEIFSSLRGSARQLLAVQVLRIMWNGFYQYFGSDATFRNFVRRYLDMPHEERTKELNALDNEYHQAGEYETIISNYKNDSSLWRFLELSRNDIFSITDWESYRRAADMFISRHRE